jgi:chromosome segregation ATPase
MLGNTTPTPSQIASTVDFLTVLEMASDPKKVKAALSSIKDAQAALDSQAQALEKAKAEIEAATAKLATQENKALNAQSKAEGSIINSTKAIADVVQAKEELEAMRQEMGNKHGTLDLRQQDFDAYVKRKEADFKREEGLIAEARAALDKAAAKAASDAQEAEALRANYEVKLAKLQALAA